MRSSQRVRNHIGGRSVAAESAGELVDPCTGETAGEASLSRQAEVDAAADAAAGALPDWRSAVPGDRSRVLLRLADALESCAEEFAHAESVNAGKPLAPTLEEEILPSIDQLRFFAGAARLLDGPAAGEYLAGHTSMIRREAVGVCAQITPWNYPFMMAIWKIAPALAAGNTVVLKPAETTPVTSALLAEVAADHLPAGVLNVVCGDRRTGQLLAAHPVPDMVSLTGSVRAGREVAASAGGALKRLHLELGGNAAVVVAADADIEHAAAEIAAAGYVNAGQDCVAASRILVAGPVYEEFVAALAEQADRTTTGHPGEADVDYGPLNNKDQLARVTGLLERLPARARVRTGGSRVGDSGYFFAPTVITDVDQTDEIVQEEIFGPVLTVQSYDDFDEAVRLANGVRQGLACSVWTRDHATALRAARVLDFGCVWLNTHLRFPAEMPHGGVKDSGYGKDLSAFSLADYTRVKHVMAAL